MRYVSIFIFVLLSAVSLAQPKYLFPIRPGEQNFLAGTMGEMRSGHFHGGIDIKTGGRVGLPVHATADGYIWRINVNSGGYGHALYVRHKDGSTSVYAHLDRFIKEVEAYVRNEQYKNESYEIRLFPEKNQFQYQQGDVIAYSGNTGSSSGPHLHFEIRDKDQRFLDPLSYGFDEVKDNLPPIIKQVAFTTLDNEARINGAAGRFEFDVIKVNGKFTTTKPIQLSGKIGIQTYHYDNMNGTWSRNGIPELTMLINGDTTFRQLKKEMTFRLNRHILVHYDYPRYKTKRRKFNKLYRAHGNSLGIYTHEKPTVFEADSVYEIRMVLRDAFDNLSVFETKINNRPVVYPANPGLYAFSIRDNALQFVSPDTTATIHYGYQKSKISPYTRIKDKNYFIWDLREGLPDSIITEPCTYDPKFYAAIPSGYEFEFFNRHFDLKTKKSSLFDTVYLRFEKGIDTTRNLELFHFYNRLDPLKTNITLTLKPEKYYDDKNAVFAVFGKRLNYQGGERKPDGSWEFSTRDFATYTIAPDTIAPVITPISWRRDNVRIKITDDLSGISKYEATLDGNFLMMQYDAKKNMLYARPRNPNISLKGEFILTVTDNLDNQTSIKRTL